jgi:hypothetical protein
MSNGKRRRVVELTFRVSVAERFLCAAFSKTAPTLVSDHPANTLDTRVPCSSKTPGDAAPPQQFAVAWH